MKDFAVRIPGQVLDTTSRSLFQGPQCALLVTVRNKYKIKPSRSVQFKVTKLYCKIRKCFDSDD